MTVVTAVSPITTLLLWTGLREQSHHISATLTNNTILRAQLSLVAAAPPTATEKGGPVAFGDAIIGGVLWDAMRCHLMPPPPCKSLLVNDTSR